MQRSYVLFGFTWIIFYFRAPVIRLKPLYKTSVIIFSFRIWRSQGRAIPCSNATSWSVVSEFDKNTACHATVLCGNQDSGQMFFFSEQNRSFK